MLVRICTLAIFDHRKGFITKRERRPTTLRKERRIEQLKVRRVTGRMWGRGGQTKEEEGKEGRMHR
jgi:hypothetical protein